MIALVLPLKNFIHAKQRLSGVLTAHERHGLFQAMVEDILLQLSLCQVINKVVVVSNDAVAELLAEKYGFYCLSEQGQGLNSAVSQAREDLRNSSDFSNIHKMLVVHGDLPLLNHKALARFIGCANTELILATDLQGLGTNAMLLPVNSPIDFQYGENSRQKHLQQAQLHSLTASQYRLPALAMDIDEPHDLLSIVQLLAQDNTLAPKTACYLSESGIAKRILCLGLTPINDVNLLKVKDLNRPVAFDSTKHSAGPIKHTADSAHG